MSRRAVLAATVVGLSIIAQISGAAAEVKYRGDGRSLKTAITVLNAGSHRMGVHMEYVYIRQRMPGCKVVQQTLLERKGRFYDELALENCRMKLIYFDVTQFLGPGKKR